MDRRCKNRQGFCCCCLFDREYCSICMFIWIVSSQWKCDDMEGEQPCWNMWVGVMFWEQPENHIWGMEWCLRGGYIWLSSLSLNSPSSKPGYFIEYQTQNFWLINIPSSIFCLLDTLSLLDITLCFVLLILLEIIFHSSINLFWYVSTFLPPTKMFLTPASFKWIHQQGCWESKCLIFLINIIGSRPIFRVF